MAFDALRSTFRRPMSAPLAGAPHAGPLPAEPAVSDVAPVPPVAPVPSRYEAAGWDPEPADAVDASTATIEMEPSAPAWQLPAPADGGERPSWGVAPEPETAQPAPTAWPTPAAEPETAQPAPTAWPTPAAAPEPAQAASTGWQTPEPAPAAPAAPTAWPTLEPAQPAPTAWPTSAAAAPISQPTTSTYHPEQFKPVFADPIAGGGVDDGAFACPGCGRTLNRGELLLQCEGCGQRFLLDIGLKRAGMLIGAAAAATLVVTLLLVNVFSPPKPATLAGSDPASAGGGGAGSGSAIVPVDVPSAAMAALRGTVTINERLAAEAPALQKALDAKSFRTSTVVKILRRMAIDTRTGAGMLKPMSAWEAASGHQAALAAFYEELGGQIEKGLSASVTSAKAYKRAAKQVLATLRDAPVLDASARTLATANGVEIPAAEFPSLLD